MNTIEGTITKVEDHDCFHRVEVDINGFPIELMTLELNEHFRAKKKVFVLIKESDIVINKGSFGTSSMDNGFPAAITFIRKGEVFCELDMSTGYGCLRALVSRASLERMKLAPGDQVQAFVRANEIALKENN